MSLREGWFRIHNTLYYNTYIRIFLWEGIILKTALHLVKLGLLIQRPLHNQILHFYKQRQRENDILRFMASSHLIHAYS